MMKSGSETMSARLQKLLTALHRVHAVHIGHVVTTTNCHCANTLKKFCGSCTRRAGGWKWWKNPNNEQNEAEVTEWETPVQETGQRTRSVMIVTVPDLPAPKNEAEDTAECCYKRLNVPHDSVKTNSLSLALCSSLLPFLFITSVWENYWNPCILHLTLIVFSMKKSNKKHAFITNSDLMIQKHWNAIWEPFRVL